MLAATKAHVVSFGKWQSVRLDSVTDVEPAEVRVRTLLVDGKVREYTIGQPHDVTEHVFVVLRAARLNDALPNEKQSRWVWQWGGWVQVDRVSGRVTPVKLLNFDPQSSVASWYRDYIAYCGVSDDNAHIYAIVIQLGMRKPILHKALDGTIKPGTADPLCASPVWERKPMRVEFSIANGSNLTFTVWNRALELTTADEDDPE